MQTRIITPLTEEFTPVKYYDTPTVVRIRTKNWGLKNRLTLARCYARMLKSLDNYYGLPASFEEWQTPSFARRQAF